MLRADRIVGNESIDFIQFADDVAGMSIELGAVHQHDQFFTALDQFAFRSPEAELVRVDATMPAHRHGMNYRPSVHNEGAGRWRVEGLLWHMSGLWELQVHVKLQQKTYTLRQNVTLR